MGKREKLGLSGGGSGGGGSGGGVIHPPASRQKAAAFPSDRSTSGLLLEMVPLQRSVPSRIKLFRKYFHRSAQRQVS